MQSNLVRRAQARGEALLEVMFALWLIGIAALGAVALQLWTARIQQSMVWQEHATQLIDAAAEALRAEAYPMNRIQAELGTAAAAWLPVGRLRIVDQGAGIRQLTLHWNDSGLIRCLSIAVLARQ